MPTKDGVDLRQCVDLLTHMLEQDNVGSCEAAHQGGVKAKRAVRGKKPFLTTGRLSRHEGPSKSITYSRGRRGGGRIVRTSCGIRQKPARNSDVSDEELEITDEDFNSGTKATSSSHRSSSKKREKKRDDVETVKTHPLLEPSYVSSTTHAHPVLFNQRLLSSTPLDTPVKKTLVERNGVLYLNGSTDTQILNATDEALALRPPGPDRQPGPTLATGHIQFVPNPGSGSLFQYRSSAREPMQRAPAPQMLDAPERTRAALPNMPKVKPNHDGYSLYSSTISSDAHCQAVDGNAQADRGNVYTLPHSRTPQQPGTLSNQPNHDMNSPYGGYSAPLQYIPNSVSTNGQFAVINSALGVGNLGYMPKRTVMDQHQQVSSSIRGFDAGSNRHPSSAVTSTGNDNVAFCTPIVNNAYDHLLSSGSLPETDNTLRDLNAATSYPHGVAATRTVGNLIDSCKRADTQPTTAPLYTRHTNQNAQTYVKQVPLLQTDLLSGRTVANTDERAEQGTACVSADRVDDDSASRETINSQQIVSLLKQLREVVVANRQTEIIDLLNDICEVARTPAVVRSVLPTSTATTTRKFSVDVEIAMQPLRSENAHLRRQLRIVKQQLREKEDLVTAIQKPDDSYQVLHLTMLTRHLEKQLDESRTEVESLRRRIELLGEECERMSRDKSAMLSSIARKDNDHLKELQDRAFALNQVEQALQAAKMEKTLVEQRMAQLNCDCQRLNQQLQQKNAECQRSRDLVRSLHDLMSRLVHDIQSSRPTAVAAVSGPSSGQLDETLNAVRLQLSQISFATPQQRHDTGRARRTARRSLNYGDDEPPSCDRPEASSLARPNDAPYVDVTSRHRTSSPRPSAAGTTTTVKELLTPLAERMQQQKDSETAASPRAVQFGHVSTGILDSTLTEESSTTDSDDRTAGMTHDCDTFDQSRWSASDYFNKYPPTRQFAEENLAARYVRESSKQRWNDETKKKTVHDDSLSTSRVLLSPGMDIEFSTMLSSVRPNDSVNPFRARSPEPVHSDADSVGTAASLDSISTEDDTAFRAGLAQLDANIARVQQQLRCSTSSPMAQLNLGRSYNSV